MRALGAAGMRPTLSASRVATPAGSVAPAAPAGALSETTNRVIAIGISTGGVQSIEVVLRGLDRTCPGIVMVQHMPERFNRLFCPIA